MRCPACKAENAEGPSCRRCKADLSLLLALEGQRRRALAEARRLLSAGDFERARALAEDAAAMREDAESRRLLALCHLLRRDFGRAWGCYQSGERPA